MPGTPREFFYYEYAEAGDWTRHYSAIRATITTFLIGLSVTLMSIKWDTPSWVFFGSSIFAWGAAAFFLIVFTGLTMRDHTYQKRVRGVIDPAFAERNTGFRPTFTDEKDEHDNPIPKAPDRPEMNQDFLNDVISKDPACKLVGSATIVFIIASVLYYNNLRSLDTKGAVGGHTTAHAIEQE